MPNVIKIKRSTTTLTPTSLQFGELALYSNGSINKIYVGNSANSVVTLFDSTAGSVSSFQTTLSGLTPNGATTGVVTLSGTLGVANGGTGATTHTGNAILIGNGTSALISSGVTITNNKINLNEAGIQFGKYTTDPTSNFNEGNLYYSNTNALKLAVNNTTSRTIAFDDDIKNSFSTISANGTDVIADQRGDTVTFTPSNGLVITANATNDTITFSTNASSSNGANTIVLRDANGSFSANVVTASLSGNASSATNVGGGAADQLVYQSGSGSTSFVPAPTGSNQILVTGASNLGTSSWIATTGTGNVVRQTSPSITTSITTGNTSFNLINTNATTINFGGAGTTIDIGAATGNTNIKNNLTVAGNATITGDLVVQGNTVTVNTATLEVEDSLISLAKGNTADAIDIGFYGRYGSSATYAGLFRDAGDSKFRLFTGLTEEPNTVVNLAGTGYATGTLVANLEGSVANATGYPVASLANLGTNVATFLTTPSSSNLLNAITDETGTGSLVFATSPTLVTPTLGVATATSINKVTITAPAISATLTLSNGSSLITSGGHSLTLTTSGATNVTLPTSGTLINSDVTTLSSLSSIGTITAGTWNANTIAVAYGGTGTTNGSITGTTALSFVAGGTNQNVILRGSGTGGVQIGAGAAADNNKLLFPGSTSGTITMVPTGVAGTTTLTLPAITGIVLTDNSTIDGGTY